MIARRTLEAPFLFSEMGEGGKKFKASAQEAPGQEKKPEVIRGDVNCQYCEDVGQCGYCKRGREEISALKQKRRK